MSSVPTEPVLPAPPGRRRARLLLGAFASAAVVVGMVIAVVPSASAATLFSDDFESGNSNNWSKSGGTWAVVTDGSKAFQQSNLTSDLARVFAGSTSWTNYSVQARVKPLAFSGTTPFVGIGARTASNTQFYRLALLSTNRVELQAVNGSSVTVIGAVNQTVSTGTFVTLRIDVSGTTISGFVNGTRIASGTNSALSAGRISLQTFHATASFDDVLVSDAAAPPPTTTTSTRTTPPPTTTSPPPTTSTSNPPPNNNGLIGWATQSGGTTGGNGGPTVNVSNLTDLTNAVSSSTTQIVRVSGNFTCSADVRIASNKTVLGVGSNSGLTGCGLNMKGVNNVIVRNMKIAKVPAGNGNGDAIHIESSTHLWIDHNDLSSDTTHGTDFYDGLLDITHAADFITVSWNVLHDHIKCSLLGHSDSNASEDTGHLRVTYHHNAFLDCQQRNPRVRFGNPVHVFNNYYFHSVEASSSYGIATTENAGVLVEGNYFENVAAPTHIGEGSSSAGNLVARNNTLVNSGTILTNGSVAAIPYSYSLDPSGNVKSIVTSGAGTGKIST
jgi:pectate lyase